MTRVLRSELPYFVGNVLAALALLPEKRTATVMTLSGDLGSGKTTFVQEFARKLGIPDTVQSPTYVLLKTYAFEGDRTSFGRPRRYRRLIHIDAYRLESPEEFDALMPQKFMSDPQALVLVEWPERLAGKLPEPDIRLVFSQRDAPDERDIEIG